MAELGQRNHPQRDLLEKELQQRFFPALQAPCRICHFMLTLAASSRQAEFGLMQQRAALLGVVLQEGDTDLNLQFDTFDQMQSYVKSYAKKMHFKISVNSSAYNDDGVAVRGHFCCSPKSCLKEK